MEAPPPPPPPHGEQPRSTKSGGLPDGKYDIFVIPPSSAGSGFLYLPSLNTQRNSFLAGCLCTATVFFFYSVALPVVKEWFYSTIHGGGSGVLMLVLGVGVVSWALGKTQGEGATGQTSGTQGSASSSSRARADPPPPPPREPTPPPFEEHTSKQAPPHTEPASKSPPPKPKAAPTADAKSAWEKAREETRKREEERKRAAELQRRREELEKERKRQREKETLDRLEREWKEKKAVEEEAAKKAEAELKAKQAKDETDKKVQREKERKEREAREALLKAAKEAREAKEALEKTRKEEQERKEAEAKAAKSSNVSSNKRPPMPSARTERDDDAYSFRPYDRQKTNQKSSAGSVYSDDSYAPSATTAKTTPPASERGPYTTKDPDKIIIKGVYSFNNAFMRTPISQLISGQGAVTDGLILRITTEGLFIDDDVRGIPQREWDVKAWTMKLAEVSFDSAFFQAAC